MCVCCVVSEADDGAGTDEKMITYSGTDDDDDVIAAAESIET